MNTRIFNLIVLDESGSMEVIKQQAIMGVNETVQTIKSAQKEYEDQEHIVSLVTFNSRAVKTVYDKVQAENVAELTEADYCPNCGTPLYDAMGQALNDLRQYVADKDKVLVTIITDGYENAAHAISFFMTVYLFPHFLFQRSLPLHIHHHNRQQILHLIFLYL